MGCLVARWTRILRGERKQLLAAGAGAGLAAAFAAPLASSLLVIESIERFDAPKTAITTLLAGVVAGAVASMVFPVNSYHLIQVAEPGFSFWNPGEVLPVACSDYFCLRKIIFHDDGLFQTGVCNGKVFGIYEDVLSVAGCLYYFLYAGQLDGWGRTVSFWSRRNPAAMHQLCG